ncbi:MAG: carbohydrate ABC transporter permease [Candidatus Limiplasma sp.]|nr:carbohydrate ABC transporter permease [Clostridiales bacterium]MDY4061427.1 carbohydrate ABC transporter permease [Candidatus Limiplasma sp.]
MRTTKKGKFFLYLILTLGALLILFPMYITITTTFKTPAESAVSFFTLPKSLYLGNYATVLQDEKLYYAYGNTILITVVSLLGEMLILPPMGFALSRGMKQNRFFKGLYFFFLLGIFLPWQVRMMPVVKLMGWLGLLSPLGITLLYIAHATCESMFLYVGYLATVSDSIEEAAYIDGASTFQIYTRVILPLMTPILSTVLIREGLAIWNDFQMPLITLNRSSKLWTLTIYLNNFQSELSVDYNLSFACLMLTCLPIVIFYIIMQKQIMGGLTSGAVKG